MAQSSNSVDKRLADLTALKQQLEDMVTADKRDDGK